MICPPGWPPYYKSLWSWVSERVALFIPRVELCHIYCFALSPNMIILKINFDIDRKLPLQADIIIRRIIGALWGAVHSFFWSAATVRPFVPSQKVDLNCLFLNLLLVFLIKLLVKNMGKFFLEIISIWLGKMIFLFHLEQCPSQNSFPHRSFICFSIFAVIFHRKTVLLFLILNQYNLHKMSDTMPFSLLVLAFHALQWFNQYWAFKY